MNGCKLRRNIPETAVRRLLELRNDPESQTVRMVILSPVASSLARQNQTGANRSMRWFSGSVGVAAPALLAARMNGDEATATAWADGLFETLYKSFLS